MDARLDCQAKISMDPNLRRLFFSLILGLGLFFGSIITIGTKRSHLAYANGAVRYVAPAPLGSDSNNDCLDQIAPCATIQRAVDQAIAGDEIRVAGGIYTDLFTRSRITSVVTQAVYISKSLAVRGGYTTTNWNAADFEENLTILDAQGMGRVVNIETPAVSTPISVTIEGLRLENGNAVGQKSPGGPEGGGGIHGYDITATLRHNYIAHNNGSQSGGGVLLVGNGPFTLINNTVVTNSLETASNYALGGGIALAIFPGSDMDVALQGNVVRGNTARVNDSAVGAKGGGLYILGGDNVVLTDNIIQANEAELVGGGVGQGGGGGVYLEGSRAMMTNTAIVDNQITGQGFGTGIFAFGGNVDLLHTTVAGNSGGDGSGINVLAGAATLTNTILVSHTYGITVSSGSTAIFNGVLWYSNTLNTGGEGFITVTNEYTGDPAFAADGYHLMAGSAAIDRGVDAGVRIDFDGDLRPIGIDYDIGADEFPAVLKATKQATPNPVQAGEALTYTVHVTNAGNVTLTAFITDILPSQVIPTGVLTWPSIMITPNGHWVQTVSVTVATDYSGSITNVVYVTTIEGATSLYTHVSQVDPITNTPAISLTGVVIDGPTMGIIQASYTFTARVTPTTAVQPITYTWLPAPNEGQDMNLVTYTWAATGTQAITVTAMNVAGIVTATHIINISSREIYLPLLLKP